MGMKVQHRLLKDSHHSCSVSRRIRFRKYAFALLASLAQVLDKSLVFFLSRTLLLLDAYCSRTNRSEPVKLYGKPSFEFKLNLSELEKTTSSSNLFGPMILGAGFVVYAS